MSNAANPSKASKLASRRRRVHARVSLCLATARRARICASHLFSIALAATALTAFSASVQAAPATAPADGGGAQPARWLEAMAKGQWSAAIELLETVPESSRTAAQWLLLARALERRSQLVESFAAYERVHELAAEGGAGARDVERLARAESSELASRIPWAEVSLARALPIGALVFVDQQWLEPARLRSPYPVNPGWHTFLVESNGEVLVARRAFFEEGQTRLVPLTELHISGLDASASGATHLGASAADGPSTSSPSPRSLGAPLGQALGGKRSPEPSRSLTAPRSLAWHLDDRTRPDADHDASHDDGGLLRASYVTLGVGALGTLVGTGFLVSALNTRSTIGDYSNCFSSRCDANARADAEHDNRTWRARAAAATASYAVGLTGLVAGGVLWLLHRDSSARATTVNIADLSLELAPRFSPHGAMLRGTF